MAAVRRGQVKSTDTPTGQVFYFPKTIYSAGTVYEKSEVMEQRKEVEQADFQNYGRAIDNMQSGHGQFFPLGPNPFASRSSSSGAIRDKNPEVTIVDHIETLPAAQSRIQKTVAVAEKIAKVVDQAGNVGPRVGQVMAEVKSGMEAAEKVLCDLSFALKFKKSLETRKELTQSDAVKLAKTVDGIVVKLVEDVKVVRALLTK